MTGVNLWVPLALAGLAAVLALLSALRRGGASVAVQAAPASWLVHSINDDRCTGCEACVSACPTQVLELSSHKARVIRFDQCVQCEKCVWVCPTRAMVMHRPGEQPPPIQVPDVDAFFQTRVPGQYLIGEAAARPLVKNGANIGRAVIEHMIASGLQPGPAADPHRVDVAIVGSGPAGLSAALTCIRRGLRYVVLEKDRVIASTISSYPRGKPFMNEPVGVTNLSYLPVFEGAKEELLGAWQRVIARTGMNLRLGEAVGGIRRTGDEFELTSTTATWRARRVVLAVGVRGRPRSLGVAGEQLPHVATALADPDAHRGQPVLVIGGGDVALEAAVALAGAGARVTLSYRGRNFNRAQRRNKSAAERLAADGRIRVMYKSQVAEIRDGEVSLSIDGGDPAQVAARSVFVLIGAEPPVGWLAACGVDMVDRPHGSKQAATDALIGTLVRGARPCPDDPDAAADYVLRVPASRPAVAAPAAARRDDRATAPQRRLSRGTPPPPLQSARRRALSSLSGLLRLGRAPVEAVPLPLPPPDDFDFDDTTKVELAPPGFD